MGTFPLAGPFWACLSWNNINLLAANKETRWPRGTLPSPYLAASVFDTGSIGA